MSQSLEKSYRANQGGIGKILDIGISIRKNVIVNSMSCVSAREGLALEK